MFRQWRATKEKNRILANQIAEAVEYREKLREQKKIQAAADDQAAGAGLSISDFTSLTDEQLFLCLRDLIESERLFLQPDIAVEQVSQASGFTSADTFTRNFRAKYGMTPTAYKQTKA